MDVPRAPQYGTARTPRRRLTPLVAGLLVAAGLLAPAAGASGRVAPAVVAAPTVVAGPAAEAAPGVRVVDGRLTRDGRPFLPRGANAIGVLLPDACPTSPAQSTRARAVFGRTELLALRDRWHADTVRLQVSQRGLDPLDPVSSPAYLARVRHAVRLARDVGLVVVLSMQDQSSSCGSSRPLPTAATERAWRALAPQHLADPYVVLELFNEPQNPSTAAGWAQWQHGGAGPVAAGAEPYVGHEALVGLLRGLGFAGVLLADGAGKAGRLQGVPALADPQLGYAVHPYWFRTRVRATLQEDRAEWDLRFGDLSRRVPVVATEWNASNQCSAGGPERAPDLLAYLQERGIGLTAHAFDVPGTLVAETDTWSPSTLEGFSCDGGRDGADVGELVLDAFARQAAAERPAPPTARLRTPAPGAVVSGVVRVEAATTGGTPVLLVDGVPVPGASPWSWAGDDDGRDHVLEVRVTAPDGASAGSSAAVRREQPAAGAVAAPTGLVASERAAGGAALTWDAAGADVRAWRVYRDGVLQAEVTAPGHEDPAAARGTAPTYAVRAVATGAGALGPAAQAVAELPDVTAPAPPSDLTAQLDRTTGVDLTWEPGTDDVAVASHRVRRDGVLVAEGVRGSAWSDVTAPLDTDVTYEVEAVDAAGGVSAPGEARTLRTAPAPDTTAPEAPTGLRVVRVASTSVALAWDAVLDAAKYVVSRPGADPVVTGRLDAALGGLTPSTAYEVTVQARDAAGNLSAPTGVTATTAEGDVQPPTAPTRLRASGTTSTGTTLAWDASRDDRKVVGYVVSRPGAADDRVTGTSRVLTGLPEATATRVVVRAVDAAGNLSAESALTVTTPRDTTPPGAPPSPRAVAPVAWAVDVSWLPAVDRGGSGTAAYRVYRSGTAGPLRTVPATATAFRDTTVRAGTAYEYTVQAVDARGNAGPRSALARVTTPRARETRAPTRPTALVARTTAPGTVTLTWTASRDETALVGYHVLRGGTWVGDSTTASYVDGTATRGTRASWTVVAFDTSANVSPASAAASAVP